jgi:hypothetical protein
MGCGSLVERDGELFVEMDDDAPRCAIVSPARFYLICERREDGGLRVICPEVPGLALSHADPDKVMRDVMPAINAIERHNRKRK